MRKQKAATPNDPGIKTPKMFKFATPTSSQTPAPSQSNNPTQIIDPTANDLDKLTQIWNHAKKNKITLSEDQVKCTELKNRLAQTNIEIERLTRKISKGKEEHEKLAKDIEAKCKTRDAIIEGQNSATNLSSRIREHINAIIDTQEYCKECQQQSIDLCNNVVLKQQEIIQKLTEQFNEKVSMKTKDLKDQLESKCEELMTFETGCQEFDKKIKEMAQVMNDINDKVEEHQVIVEKNKEKYDKEIAEILETIKEKESNLKVELEAKYKLETENNEISANYNALASKYKALQIVDSGYENQIEFLKSSEAELKEKGKHLNNQLDDLKNIHLAFISNKDLESAEYRKQLQDLTFAYSEATDELTKATSINEELSKTAGQTVENHKQLENLLMNKDDEMMKIRINLSNVLDKNNELTKKIQTQNEELIAAQKQVCKNRADFETHGASRDETARKEAEMSNELATIEKQLSEECEEFEKLVNEAADEKLKTSKEANELKCEIKQKDELITRAQKTNANLDREIQQKQSKHKKQMQDAIQLSKQCQLAEHEKQIKEQNIKMNFLDKELSDVKIKYKKVNAEKCAEDAKEEEKYEAEVKKMKSNYEDLKKQLSAMQEENENVLSELKKAEALIESTNAKQETTTSSLMPKPILKSTVKESPRKKVQFDLEPSLDLNHINASEIFAESERRYRATASRPDWAKIEIPMTSEEPDTTTSVVTEPQSSKPRKFFKQPRTQKNLTLRFGRR